jgi:hypothetical protein
MTRMSSCPSFRSRLKTPTRRVNGFFPHCEQRSRGASALSGVGPAHQAPGPRARSHGTRRKKVSNREVMALKRKLLTLRKQFEAMPRKRGAPLRETIADGLMSSRGSWRRRRSSQPCRPNLRQRTDDPEPGFAPGFVLWEACLQLATTLATCGAQCARTTCHASV